MYDADAEPVETDLGVNEESWASEYIKVNFANMFENCCDLKRIVFEHFSNVF